MYKNIIKEFPEEGSYNTYMEPFGGSYSIGFRANPPQVEIYNDLEKNVYSLFKVLSDNTLFTEFKHLCDLCVFDETLFKEYKYKLKNEINLSIVNRAFYFYYTSKNGFGGHSSISIQPKLRRNMSISAYSLLSSVDELYDIHNRLSRIIVLNRDGIELIKKYNNPNIFIYVDPPYVQHTRLSSTKYNIELSLEKHKELINVVSDSKSKILISGYENELYEDLKNFKKINFDINAKDGKNRTKVITETLWKNY